MNFPDTITVLRPTETDAYGNEGVNFDNADEHTEKCFEVVQGTLLLLPRQPTSARATATGWETTPSPEIPR